MANLIAKSPLAGQGSFIAAGTTLSEVMLGRITSVSATHGQEKALTKGLKALGVAMPAPNSFATKGDARIVWTGRDQAFLINAAPDALQGAALTDQSDGWACLRLAGPLATDALMRLIPLDLRPATFAPGHAARAPLNHMQSIIMRLDDQTFDILVFRSMAKTAWHELETALKGLAARADAQG